MSFKANISSVRESTTLQVAQNELSMTTQTIGVKDNINFEHSGTDFNANYDNHSLNLFSMMFLKELGINDNKKIPPLSSD